MSTRICPILSELDTVNGTPLEIAESLPRMIRALAIGCPCRRADPSEPKTPSVDALLSDAQCVTPAWRFDEQQADSVHHMWSWSECRHELSRLLTYVRDLQDRLAFQRNLVTQLSQENQRLSRKLKETTEEVETGGGEEHE